MPPTRVPSTGRVRRPAVALAVLALVVGATGCSARLVDTDADADEPTGQRPTPTTATTSQPPDVLDRALLEERATGRLSCDGDALRVDEAGTSVAVTGSCTVLEVEAVASTVVAGDVGRLVVSGDGAQVVVRSAQEVVLLATAATVVWETGEPRVHDDGTANATGPVGSVDAPPGPTSGASP